MLMKRLFVTLSTLTDGSVLVPMLFIIYIQDCTTKSNNVRKLAEDLKFGGLTRSNQVSRILRQIWQVAGLAGEVAGDVHHQQVKPSECREKHPPCGRYSSNIPLSRCSYEECFGFIIRENISVRRIPQHWHKGTKHWSFSHSHNVGKVLQMSRDLLHSLFHFPFYIYFLVMGYILFFYRPDAIYIF